MGLGPTQFRPHGQGSRLTLSSCETFSRDNAVSILTDEQWTARTFFEAVPVSVGGVAEVSVSVDGVMMGVGANN